MGVSIVYPYASWIATYPQFSSTVPNMAFDTTVYVLAQQYCVNDGSGPVSTTEIQTTLMGLMCSHVAQLLFGSSAVPLSPLIGRISSASEGSVSVSAEMPAATNATQAWLYQTQFGASYWVATSPYRTMTYFPAPRRQFTPWPRR